MKVNNLLLSFVLYLSLAANTHASSRNLDLESGLELKGLHQASSVIHPVTEPFVFHDTVDGNSSLHQTTSRTVIEPEAILRTPSSLKESDQQPISRWRSFTAWGERITGNILSIVGIPISAAGGTLVAIYSDLSNPRAQAGVALAGFGVFLNESGKILLENSRSEAAEIESEIESRKRKIVKAADLTPEEVERLSDEFFGMSQTYQSYIGCASKADRVLSRILSLVGPTAAVTGAVLTLSGETTIGPILAVGGAAAISAKTALQERADAHEAQLKRFKTVAEARERAQEKLKLRSSSKSSM
ncbi:MAG: hypothetical protein K2Q34_04060 [Alphaproteobacteria bacterium]|nr:hypothetical protein [Alphaproteobacteria bacterium]